jgi:hypothetical protein
MFARTIFLLLIIFVSARSMAQPMDCYKFREGKFRINDVRAGGVVIAERKGGYQTESMESLKASVRFKINWLNDCTYTLTIDKVIRNENKVPFPADLTVIVKIIAINADGYTQEATSSITSGVYRSDVVKLQ